MMALDLVCLYRELTLTFIESQLLSQKAINFTSIFTVVIIHSSQEV